MELIAAVYDDWGIGANGTQPVALSADRKFFRQTTKGSTVIVGRRTVEDFPGQKPLPGRVNILLSRNTKELEGFTVCADVQQALALSGEASRVFVIGGGSVYRQLLPYCDTAYITKVHACVVSDTFLPDLDQDPAWQLAAVLERGEENGILYEICRYERA